MADRRATAAGAALVMTLLGAAWAQGPGRTQPAASATLTSARVETAPLELIEPDRFRIPTVFQPARRVTVVATDDGLVTGITAKVGERVRERQDLVQLDRTEAAARLKIAKAELKERQAAAKATPDSGQQAIAAARVEAAEARVELAQLALDRCTLKAPFAGLVLSFPVSAGQFVTKGTTVAELADVSDLRALVPVDRTRVREGQALQLSTEGRNVAGKVAALLPLPESFAPLRELATPWSAALVVVDNPTTAGVEPGQRVRNPFLPPTPIATVPGRAIQTEPAAAKAKDAPATYYVQVVRNEHVANVPVSVLGEVGPERMQVAGAFRSTDMAIVESSVQLAAGSFIRFGGAQGTQIQAMPPNPDASGTLAEVAPPSGGSPAAGTAAPARATRVAPIGSQDSALPRPAAATRPAAKTTPPAAKPASGAVPF
jgi:multidrug efflux pump subunit AcrA (membrane-fusion protein)